jgi:hypothetical protein
MSTEVNNKLSSPYQQLYQLLYQIRLCCNLIWGLANNNYSLYFLKFLTISGNLHLCYIFIPYCTVLLYIVGPLSKLTEISFFCWRSHKYELLQFDLSWFVLDFFFIHNYLKDIYSMSHFYFCLPWLLESCIPVILICTPTPLFLLKYYCVVIQYHTNCNNSYLCDLQQKNDVCQFTQWFNYI